MGSFFIREFLNQGVKSRRKELWTRHRFLDTEREREREIEVLVVTRMFWYTYYTYASKQSHILLALLRTKETELEREVGPGEASLSLSLTSVLLFGAHLTGNGDRSKKWQNNSRIDWLGQESDWLMGSNNDVYFMPTKRTPIGKRGALGISFRL